MKKIIVVLLFGLLTGGVLMAQVSEGSSSEKSDDSSQKKILESISIGSKNYPVYLSLRGYVDTYYSFNVNEGATENSFRIFDSAHNEFRFGLLQTQLEVGNDDWMLMIDLAHGPNAELGNFGNVGIVGNSITSTAIKQAYASVSFFGATLTVGQYNTHIGYEVIEAYLNSHYSLSNLFGYGPFYHLGAKIDYSITEELGIMVGLVNGWDASSNHDINSEKSLTAQVSLGYIKDLDIYLNYMGGDESAEVGGWRHLFDLTSTYQLADRLNLGLNVAFGSESVSKGVESELWYGAAFYIDYLIVPEKKHNYMISIRNEYFNDSSGVRGFASGIGAHSYGLTVTGTISLYYGYFLIKPEYRLDLSDKKIYSGNKSSQSTVSMAFIGVY